MTRRTVSVAVDGEMLALLLWDFFGPEMPRFGKDIPRAMPGHIEAYRRAAKDIVTALDFNAAVAANRKEKSE